MSLDGETTVLKVPLSIPDASFRNVTLALNAVRMADVSCRLNEGWLKADGIGQAKQAARVIRFLDLTDQRKKLKSDVVSARRFWNQFQVLLRERVADGCRHLGLGEAETQSFSDGSWADFERSVLSTQAVAGRTKRGQDAVISCFRAIDQICDMNEETFQETVRKFSANTTSTARPVEDTSKDAPETQFPIGTEDDGEIIFAQVSFTRSAKPGYYRRLAQLLLAMDTPVESSANVQSVPDEATVSHSNGR